MKARVKVDHNRHRICQHSALPMLFRLTRSPTRCCSEIAFRLRRSVSSTILSFSCPCFGYILLVLFCFVLFCFVLFVTPVDDQNPTRVRKKLESPVGHQPDEWRHTAKREDGRKTLSTQFNSLQASWDSEREKVPAACAPCPRRLGDGARTA